MEIMFDMITLHIACVLCIIYEKYTCIIECYKCQNNSKQKEGPR